MEKALRIIPLTLLLLLAAEAAAHASEVERSVAPTEILSDSKPETGPEKRVSYVNENFKKPEVDYKAAAAHFQEASRFGLPSADNLRLLDNLLISYDRRTRGPQWVLQHMSRAKFHSNQPADNATAAVRADRKNSNFFEDADIHPYFRSRSSDYARSGYDRGHMCPSHDNNFNQKFMDQSFILSNVMPQLPNFNRGGWVRLESYARFLARRAANMYVVTGPLYMPKLRDDGHKYVEYRVIGADDVAVPSHFYKVWLHEDLEGRLSLEAFLYPHTAEVNADSAVENFRLPVDQLEVIERASGLIFFDQLNRSQVEWPTELQFNYVDRKVTFGNRERKRPDSSLPSSPPPLPQPLPEPLPSPCLVACPA